MLALRSGDPGFKTGSNLSLNLILVVPGSTWQLHLYFNWFASGFSIVVVVGLFCHFIGCISFAQGRP